MIFTHLTFVQVRNLLTRKSVEYIILFRIGLQERNRGDIL